MNNNLFVLNFLKGTDTNVDDSVFTNYPTLLQNPVYLTNHGFGLMHGGKYEEAIGYFDKAIAIDGDLAEAYLNRGDAYFNLGDLANANKDWRVYEDIGLFPHYIRIRELEKKIFI